MDFEMTDEQRAIVETVRKFSANEIYPRAEQIDAEDEFPRDIWDKMGELGLMGIAIPEEYGGIGGDLMTAVLAIKNLGGSAGIALSYGAHLNLCAHNLLRTGSPAQREHFLPKLASGEWIGCMALTEPEAGSDATSLRCTAVKDGDEYVLNGAKTFITNAPIADVALLYAKTNPEAGPMGITAFIFETDRPGWTVPKKLKKMGHHGSPTGEIVMEDLRVPADAVIGAENMGIAVMMAGLDVERAFFAGAALGMSERAFELALKYAQEREQFGRPIAKFQLIQAKLADMYTKIEANRGLAERAVMAAQDMERGGKGTDIHLLAASALLFSARTAEEVVYDAVQIHGGYGYMDEYEISRLYRDVRLFTIGAGTTEVRQMVIARELLKM
jgi:isovaleryl-CoA dehydrogenase